MRFDTGLTKDIAATAAHAARVEAEGFDGAWIGETRHDPFMQSLEAARSTEHTTIGTAVAIAFARNPMTTAVSAYDLAGYSQGRFVLGLGSQVRAHIERRFSMPWSAPARRMREFVLAMRAIWATWQDGAPLAFEGEFYRHTLMTPFFSPPSHEWGPPPVYLAGVGRLMTEVAGEVADGFLVHAFSTPTYMREVTIPALLAGRRRAGGLDLAASDIAGPVFACVGRTEAELQTAITGTRAQIAFYASTPAYRPVLDLHGWGDLQPELTALSKEGRWSQMGAAIDDEVLHAFAVVGSPQEVGRGIVERFDGLLTRANFYAPYEHDPAIWAEVLAAARSHSVCQPQGCPGRSSTNRPSASATS